MNIVFDESSKMVILGIFGMSVDEQGYIVTVKDNKRVLTRKGETVTINEFAGIMKDYGLVKGDLGSLIELSDYIKLKGQAKENQ